MTASSHDPRWAECPRIPEAITFDDVLLVPRRSNVLPSAVDVGTRLTPRIRLNIPLVSAPMDTVTESQLAIALAQEGGIGIIHKNLSIEDQCREVRKVKRSESGVILDPVTLRPGDSLARAKEVMALHNISGVPITEEDGRIAGIITRRDLKFLESTDLRIRDVMTAKNLVTGPPGTTLDEAERILNRARVEKLLLVDHNGKLTGLITMRDIERSREFRHSCKDDRGRLRVGAAVGVHDYKRVDALIAHGVDVIVVDTAHGHTDNVIDTVQALHKRYDVEIIAGNVATAEAAEDLIAAGADALKVGIGPGSICTTRVITGVGVPQWTAIITVGSVAARRKVPVIADGGIRRSGDIVKAIAAGADSVMMGSLLAGLEESPGESITWRGRRFKQYRGMGSAGAMAAGSADRYGQTLDTPPRRRSDANSLGDFSGGVSRETSDTAPGKLVPEGVEGRVPYRGPLSDFVSQLIGGLRAGMGYCGASTIEELQTKARFCRVTTAGVVESHPHDVTITKESPNYEIEYPTEK